MIQPEMRVSQRFDEHPQLLGALIEASPARLEPGQWRLVRRSGRSYAQPGSGRAADRERKLSHAPRDR